MLPYNIQHGDLKGRILVRNLTDIQLRVEIIDVHDEKTFIYDFPLPAHGEEYVQINKDFAHFTLYKNEQKEINTVLYRNEILTIL